MNALNKNPFVAVRSFIAREKPAHKIIFERGLADARLAEMTGRKAEEIAAVRKGWVGVRVKAPEIVHALSNGGAEAVLSQIHASRATFADKYKLTNDEINSIELAIYHANGAHN